MLIDKFSLTFSDKWLFDNQIKEKNTIWFLKTAQGVRTQLCHLAFILTDFLSMNGFQQAKAQNNLENENLHNFGLNT